MFYQVIASLFFEAEDEARDFYHDCEVALPKSSTINLEDPNFEQGSITLLQCFHDEEPNRPCIALRGDATEYPPPTEPSPD